MSTNSALPCPFCGGEPAEEKDPQGWPVIRCLNCGALGPCVNLDREIANRTWNERASSAPPDSQVSPDIPVSGWISVDDEMPPDPSKAIVWYVPSKNAPHALMAWFSGREWRFIDEHADSRLPERVTHWMPLPAAPGAQP